MQIQTRKYPFKYVHLLNRPSLICVVALNNQPTRMKKDTEKSENFESKNVDAEKFKIENAWSIRPCAAYKDEYDDCTSIKARFHQYFIHGQETDCSQWRTDYNNCLRYEKSNGNDIEAGQAIVQSEEIRRNKRLSAHYGNTTWKKRAKPPADWSAPLPDWMEKRNQNTYLQVKQMELDGRSTAQPEEKSYCTVM